MSEFALPAGPADALRGLLAGGAVVTAGAAVSACSSSAPDGPTAPSVSTSASASAPGGRRVLLAYFSRPGENYHCGGRRDLEVGNIGALAGMLAGRTLGSLLPHLFRVGQSVFHGRVPQLLLGAEASAEQRVADAQPTAERTHRHAVVSRLGEAVAGLSGELEDPARDRDGNPACDQLFHERVVPAGSPGTGRARPGAGLRSPAPAA
jgi:hypothetical protein